MKIAVLISGFMRTILYNIENNKKIFKNYDVDYFLHISNDEKIDTYFTNKIDYQKIIDELNPVQILYENEIQCEDNENINMKRMWYKLYILNNIKNIYQKNNNIKYDIVIRFRPDIYILSNDIDFNSYNLDDPVIYGENDEMFFGNSFIMDTVLNLFIKFDYILNICKTQKKNKKRDIFTVFIKLFNIKFEKMNIDYKLVLTLCNIIALSGDSGTGKTTLMNKLGTLFEDSLLKIEGDRYHKWERNSPNWKNYTHLNPSANHISKFKNDVFDLKIGNNIYQVDYDHSNGRFTEVQELKNKNNIILCGLHTLFDKNTNKLFNLKIFLEPDEKLRYYWKIKRDVKERQYTKETVIKNIKKRLADGKKYIKPQSNESDLIIKFFTEDDFNYLDDTEPMIYLQLKVKKNIINFIKLLNSEKIKYSFKKDDYYNLYFYKIDDNFKNIFYHILCNYCDHIYNVNIESSYYTIILALIIYLKYN